MSPQTKVGGAAERDLAALDVVRHQLDAGDVHAGRRRGPAGRPALRPRGDAARMQQARQQALAAADVEDARVGLQQAALEDVAEHRVAAELAAREVPGELVGRAVRRARRFDERAPGRPWARRPPSCGGGLGADGARQRDRSQPGRVEPLQQARQHLEHDRPGRPTCGRRGRRAAAGCRRPRGRRSGARAPGRGRAARCRSRAASS